MLRKNEEGHDRAKRDVLSRVLPNVHGLLCDLFSFRSHAEQSSSKRAEAVSPIY